DLKKVEYMQDFVGQVFTGTISGVTSFGFFVELPNTVEGLVHVSTLSDDYYQYVEKQLMLVGDFTKKIYRIGDLAKVVLVKVNVEERLIDFEVVPEEKKKKDKRKNRP
ncbi:MAG: S1 RNA-binding domain-containing protein, partial [Clostridia bacterium]|nr:S1 RNA-binding domain-containing protein [Clostridia bacterium]MDD4146389.1 S1 RNA-binding domain-containing protein [Clostridia bacterium]MDD4665033.1 S1 RNA-binding domain-containing protein [Clostridia bacterium]